MSNVTEPPEREVLFQEDPRLEKPLVLILRDSVPSRANFGSDWSRRHGKMHSDINIFRASDDYESMWIRRNGVWLAKPESHPDNADVLQLMTTFESSARSRDYYQDFIQAAATNVVVNAVLNDIIKAQDGSLHPNRLNWMSARVQLVLDVCFKAHQLPGSDEPLPADFSLRYGGLSLMNKPALRSIVYAAAAAS